MKSSYKPKVSIITAVKNNADFISRAIVSIMNQTYDNIEHIIVDNNSEDGTDKVVQKLLNKSMKYINEKDSGIYDALNKGIKLSSGEIVGFLHADDVLKSRNTINKIISNFNNAKCDIVYGDLIYFNKDKPNKTYRYWRSGGYQTNYLGRGWMPPHPTLYVKKNIYTDEGLFDCKYKISADYEWILRVFMKKKYKITYIPEVLVKMQTGGISNYSLSNIYDKTIEDLEVIKSFNMSSFAIIRKNLSKLPQLIGL